VLKFEILLKPVKRSHVDFLVFLTSDDQNYDLIDLRAALKIIFSFARGSCFMAMALALSA